MVDAVSSLAETINHKVKHAADARWLTTAAVTAVDGDTFSASVDGSVVTGIKPLGSFAPTAGDVALVGVVRGTATTQYVGVGSVGGGAGYEEYTHTFDGGVDGAHPFGDEAGSGTEMTVFGGGNMWFTTDQNGGSGLAVRIDGFSFSPGGILRERQLSWSPPGPDPTDYDPDPNPYWMGDWCEIDFCFAITSLPAGAAVQLLRFYPACAIYLVPSESTLMFCPTGKVPIPAGVEMVPIGFNLINDTRYRVRLRLHRNGNNWVHMLNTETDSFTWEALPSLNNFGGQGEYENVLVNFGLWGPLTTTASFTISDVYLDNLAFRWDPGSWVGPPL